MKIEYINIDCKGDIELFKNSVITFAKEDFTNIVFFNAEDNKNNGVFDKLKEEIFKINCYLTYHFKDNSILTSDVMLYEDENIKSATIRIWQGEFLVVNSVITTKDGLEKYKNEYPHIIHSEDILCLYS